MRQPHAPVLNLGEPTRARQAACIVYVAGYGRSGSTVLDAMLGAAPGSFGMGEVAVLFEVASGRSRRLSRCTCSRLLHDCPIWGEVLARIERDWIYGDLVDAANITRSQDTSKVRSSQKLGLATEAYSELWSLVLKTLQERTGAQLLIDSSKTATRRCSTRPLRIAQTTPFRVVMVHMVRDPAAVTWSVMKGSNRRLERREQSARQHLPITRSLIGRYQANRHARQAMERIDGMTLRYEDLCRDPVTALSAVSALVGLDPEPILERMYNGGRFGADHGVSGNRVRREGFVRIAIDDEWRYRLPTRARVAAHLSRLIDSRILG